MVADWRTTFSGDGTALTLRDANAALVSAAFLATVMMLQHLVKSRAACPGGYLRKFGTQVPGLYLHRLLRLR